MTPLVSIQNPGSEKFQEVIVRGLTKVSAFFMCLLMSRTSFHKHDTGNCIYVTIHVRKHIRANSLSDVWNIFQETLKNQIPPNIIT